VVHNVAALAEKGENPLPAMKLEVTSAFAYSTVMEPVSSHRLVDLMVIPMIITTTTTRAARGPCLTFLQMMMEPSWPFSSNAFH
jgi:hypothetical protein